jgi:hypothetical protein
MELDLRECHGTDYRGAREPARTRARPSSMKIKARRAGAVSAADSHAAVSRTVSSCAALLAGAGLLLIAGCSGATTSSSSANVGSRGPAFSAPSATAGGLHAAGGAVRGPAAPATSGQADTARLVPASQSIVYTANLTVQVRSAMGAAARAASYIAGAGGYTAAEQARAARSRQRARVSLTLKVPVPGYPAALAALGRLGRQTALGQQSSDVTQQVADVSSLVTSQEDEIAQLRALLSRAGSVSGLLQVQQQLGTDESQLESLQAQQRALDRETTYATIAVLLLGPQPRLAPARHAAARHGFGAGLAAGWHGLARATGWLLTAAGAVLPFAVVIAILGGLGYAGRHRLARLTRLTRRRPAEPAA